VGEQPRVDVPFVQLQQLDKYAQNIYQMSTSVVHLSATQLTKCACFTVDDESSGPFVTAADKCAQKLTVR
jgi:hypothetical protein